jgi:hypothetical protein
MSCYRDHAVLAASRKDPSLAVARNCGMGSSSLNGDVNAFDKLHMVLDSNSWCCGVNRLGSYAASDLPRATAPNRGACVSTRRSIARDVDANPEA